MTGWNLCATSVRRSTRVGRSHAMTDSRIPDGYVTVIRDAKSAIQAARTRAVLAANSQLIELYWTLGQLILGRQQAEGWGTNVIERLSNDLRAEFRE
jgi:predicted nuclease of restriction endonuclease-like (RecB) superfamily